MNDADSDSIRTGFIRQRRSLILISLVLLFAETSELTINKLNVFGNELTIHNPVTVTLALGLAYLYWLYRYYVYFRDLGSKGFREKHNARLAILVRRWAREMFDTDSIWKNERIKNVREVLVKNEGVSKQVTTAMQSPHEWKLAEDPDTSSIGVPHLQQILVQVKLRLFVKQANGEWWIRHEETDRVTIEGFRAMKLNSKAGLHVLMHTRIFSEYYLPFLIALTPIVYFLYHSFAR